MNDLAEGVRDMPIDDQNQPNGIGAMPAVRFEPEKGAKVERGEITEGRIRQKGIVQLQLQLRDQGDWVWTGRDHE